MLSRCIRKVAFSPPSRHMIHLTASAHREFKPAHNSQSNHGSNIIGTGEECGVGLLTTGLASWHSKQTPGSGVSSVIFDTGTDPLKATSLVSAFLTQ